MRRFSSISARSTSGSSTSTGGSPRCSPSASDELRLSEDIACNRIDLARAARRLPVILDALCSGRVHMAGLRLLAPHLTAENQEAVLAGAAGKSKRQIEELVARLWPQPPVPTIVRKLPDRSAPPPEASCGFSFGAAVPTAQAELAPAPAFAAPPSAPPRRDERPSKVSPLSEDAFKFQFTAVHEASPRIGGPACAGEGDFVRVSARVIRPGAGRAALRRAPGDRSQSAPRQPLLEQQPRSNCAVLGR